MSEYQISALGQIAGAYIFTLGISLFYFYKCRGIGLGDRIGISAHGAIFTLASLFGVVVSSATSRESFETEFGIFQAILVLGLVSIIYSFFKYKGSKLIHLLQIPNVLSAAAIWFVGGMTISHDWI